MRFVLRHLQQSPVVPDPHRKHANVDVAERDHEETAPRPTHVTAIQTAHAGISGFPHRSSRHPVEIAADKMSQRVTAECVSAEQNDVGREDNCAESDSEMSRAGLRIGKPERFPYVVRQEDEKNQREVEEVPMDVLNDQRKRPLAAISLSWLSHRA